MTDCVYFFIVFGFRQTQPHAFNKLLYYTRVRNKLSKRCNFCFSKVKHKI